jgi:hypothetical protein
MSELLLVNTPTGRQYRASEAKDASSFQQQLALVFARRVRR